MQCNPWEPPSISYTFSPDPGSYITNTADPPTVNGQGSFKIPSNQVAYMVAGGYDGAFGSYTDDSGFLSEVFPHDGANYLVLK
jgi:hypothetical protein